MAEATQNGTGTSVSIQIEEARNSNGARHAYLVQILNADGTPAANIEAVAVLEGPGSLSPAFSAKEQKRGATSEGVARLDWFRRGIYDRDIHAKITVTVAQAGAQVSFKEIDWERSDTSYNLPTKKLRF